MDKNFVQIVCLEYAAQSLCGLIALLKEEKQGERLPVDKWAVSANWEQL